MPRDIRASGALQFAVTAAVIRAERYRDHAAQLRQMAKADVAPGIRRQLLKLAEQFEAIGNRLRSPCQKSKLAGLFAR